MLDDGAAENSEPSDTISDSLRAREAALLAAILSGKTMNEAAADADMSRSSAYRIWRTDNFQEALRTARSELLESTIDKLRASARDAATALSEVFGDSTTTPAPKAQARVSAARETLAAMFKGIEVYEIEKRLARLEELAREDK